MKWSPLPGERTAIRKCGRLGKGGPLRLKASVNLPPLSSPVGGEVEGKTRARPRTIRFYQKSCLETLPVEANLCEFDSATLNRGLVEKYVETYQRESQKKTVH